MNTTAGLTYWQNLRTVLERVTASQAETLVLAGRELAARMHQGGRVYIYDTGHLLTSEMINRAGGFVGWTPLRFSLDLDNTIAHEPPRATGALSEDDVRGLVRYALQAAGIRQTDAVILGSVTGARVLPIEVALQLCQRDVYVVGLTSLEYSHAVPAQHSCGKKLYELADRVIDNHCAVGDAATPIPGLAEKMGPTSGVTAATLVWMLAIETASALTQMGDTPEVLESMNLPSAMARNEERARRYLRSLQDIPETEE